MKRPFQNVDGDADERAFGPHRFEEDFVRRPHSGEPIGFDRDAFLGTEIAHHRHRQRSIRDGMSLDRGAFRIGA